MQGKAAWAIADGLTADEMCIRDRFDYLKGLFAAMGNEQSGGMALANFDNDLATVLTASGFVMKDEYQEIFRASIADIIRWCNDTHTRMGTTSYYVTFNIGLAEGELAKFLAFTLLDEFERVGDCLLYTSG